MTNSLKSSLEAIRKRLEAATPGPWQTNSGYAHGKAIIEGISRQERVDVIVDDGTYDLQFQGIQREADAELIANAPTDIVRLLSAIEVLESALRLARFDNVNARQTAWSHEMSRELLHKSIDSIDEALAKAAEILAPSAVELNP